MMRKMKVPTTTESYPQDAEKLIVNLIRNVKLNANIDTAKNQVIVTSTVPSVYQLLLDKTKTMTLRAGVLASSADYHHPQNYTTTTTLPTGDEEEVRAKPQPASFEDTHRGDFDE